MLALIVPVEQHLTICSFPSGREVADQGISLDLSISTCCPDVRPNRRNVIEALNKFKLAVSGKRDIFRGSNVNVLGPSSSTCLEKALHTIQSRGHHAFGDSDVSPSTNNASGRTSSNRKNEEAIEYLSSSLMAGVKSWVEEQSSSCPNDFQRNIKLPSNIRRDVFRRFCNNRDEAESSFCGLLSFLRNEMVTAKTKVSVIEEIMWLIQYLSGCVLCISPEGLEREQEPAQNRRRCGEEKKLSLFAFYLITALEGETSHDISLILHQGFARSPSARRYVTRQQFDWEEVATGVVDTLKVRLSSLASLYTGFCDLLLVLSDLSQQKHEKLHSDMREACKKYLKTPSESAILDYSERTQRRWMRCINAWVFYDAIAELSCLEAQTESSDGPASAHFDTVAVMADEQIPTAEIVVPDFVGSIVTEDPLVPNDTSSEQFMNDVFDWDFLESFPPSENAFQAPTLINAD